MSKLKEKLMLSEKGYSDLKKAVYGSVPAANAFASVYAYSS